MSKAQQTRAALLAEARRQFWTRGFSNVSLREIAGGVGVDVAMIGRYFGSKRGLFDATLADLPALDAEAIGDPPMLVEAVVALFAAAPRGAETPSPTALILMNAGDPEVGDAVREAYAAKWQRPLERIIGDAARAALFSAAMFGMSVAEKTLGLTGVADPLSPEYGDQMRRLLFAALDHRAAQAR